MGKFDKRSRDQKRKAKLKKRADRSGPRTSLAYHGSKYKTPEYVGFMLRTETAIYEVYRLTNRALTDNEVEAALADLIQELRENGPVLGELEQPPDVTDVDEFIVWNIREHWRIYEESEPLPKRDDVTGVLRTVLGSLEMWRSKNMHPQGYLRFLEDFLKQAGVSVRVEKVGSSKPADPRLPGPGEGDQLSFHPPQR